jgi:hypothetical protein
MGLRGPQRQLGKRIEDKATVRVDEVVNNEPTMPHGLTSNAAPTFACPPGQFRPRRRGGGGFNLPRLQPEHRITAGPRARGSRLGERIGPKLDMRITRARGSRSWRRLVIPHTGCETSTAYNW